MPDREKSKERIPGRISPSGVIIKILIFFALILGTGAALRPLQQRLQTEMEKARDDFIKETGELWGRRIQYGSMGPSIFGVLDIRNVLILREDSSVFLSITRLRLSYSLATLFSGNKMNAFQYVRIDRPVLNFDFEKDADILERLSSKKKESPSPATQESAFSFQGLLPEKFTFRIWNGEWELSDTFGSLKLNGVKLDASIRQNRVSFQGRWNARISIPGLDTSHLAKFSSSVLSMANDSPLPIEVLMSGRISGEYSEELDEGSATVAIPSLTGNYFRLRPISFVFYLTDDRLDIRKIYDRVPAAIFLSYNFSNSGFQGRFDAENFSPASLITFYGPLREYNNALALRVSGSTGFEWMSSGDFNLAVDLSGSGPRNTIMEQASLEMGISGKMDQAIKGDLDFRSAQGALKFSGGVNFAPEDFGLSTITPFGTLSLSNFRLRGDRGISGDLFLNTYGNEISLFSDNLSAGNVNLSALDLSLYREENGLTFGFSALRFRETGLEDTVSFDSVRTCSLSIMGSADYDPAQMQVNIRLDSFSVGDILSFIDPLVSIPAIPSMLQFVAEDLSLTTEIFFITDYNHILYNAPRVVVAYEGLRDVLASASFSGTDRGFELSTANISWDNGTADFNGYIDFSDPDDVLFSLGASLRNLNYFFEGIIQDKRNISIRGSYGFQVMLGSGDNGARTGYARGEMIPIPSGDRVASLNFLISGFFDSPSNWRAFVEKFEITGLSTPSSSAALVRFTGEADNRGISIPDFIFDDGRGTLGGEIAVNWDADYKNYSFRTDISSLNRNEYYALNGTYRDGRLDLSISGQRMQLNRFSGLNAEVDGSFRLSWESPASFEAEMLLPSLALYRQNGIMRVSTNVYANQDEFSAERLRISFENGNSSFPVDLSFPILRIDRVSSRAEVEARLWGMPSERLMDVSLLANARFNYAETWLDMYRNFEFLDASLVLDPAIYNGMETDEPMVFVFNSRKENRGIAMSLNGGPRDMLRFKYTPEKERGGVFYAALSAPSPVRGTFTGFIDSTLIDALGTDLYVDMASLWRFIPPSDSIAIPAGIVTGSVKIGGTIEDPEFNGTARAVSVQILVPEFLPEPIRPVPTTFLFSGNEITFGPINAAVGQGGGIAQGWFRFDQWIPNIFSIDIKVPQENPIPYGFDISGVIANGLGYGNLNVAMENLILSITGELIALDTVIGLNLNEIAALENRADQDTERKMVSTVADINIRTGRRVEFFWPSVDFPMIQATADMGTGINITSDTDAKRFTLTGDVQLRSGEIFYLERNFYIREGTLFFRENEVQFDPSITARAELRDRSESGPVIISMIIDNAPLKSFTPRFVSNPPLSQLEIYSILGQYPQGEEGEQRNLATSVLIDSLAQFTVIQRLQRQVRDFLGLDMLSMRTQLLQNVVIQATQLTDTTTDRTYRLGNYFDNTTVFIGKYFGAEIFGEAMLSFRYEENKMEWGGLVLEPELGLEMRNPLFDIRFNMAPLHPENMFVDDVSFSLIWRRSF